MSESINTESVNTETEYVAAEDPLNMNKNASNKTTLVSQILSSGFMNFFQIRLAWYFNQRLLNFNQYFESVTDYFSCQVCL